VSCNHAGLTRSRWWWAVAGVLVGIAGGCGREAGEHPDPARARMAAELASVRGTLNGQPDSPLLYYHLGQIYERHGFQDSALAAYETSVTLHPAFPEAHYLLGQLHYDLGHVEEAIKAYEQAVRFHPDYAEAHNNLGYLHKQRGDLEAAEAAYLDALRCDAELTAARNNLAQVYRQREEWDRAIEQFRQIIATSPDFREAYVYLAMTLRHLDRSEEERAVLGDMVEQFGESSAQGAYATSRLRGFAALE